MERPKPIWRQKPVGGALPIEKLDDKAPQQEQPEGIAQPVKPLWRQAGEAQIAQYVLKQSSSIESHLYDHLVQIYQNYDHAFGDSPAFQKIYRYRIQSLIATINPQSPTYQKWLSDNIANESITPPQLVCMKPWEASPESWRTIMDDYQREVASLGKKVKATSNLFRCGRCGKSETTYFEMQSRSSDEPMTTYISCVNCGCQWKQ
jgi:DNA-directed RNA polymerase subunit M/transcription elongation factor TFIIS